MLITDFPKISLLPVFWRQ